MIRTAHAIKAALLGGKRKSADETSRPMVYLAYGKERAAMEYFFPEAEKLFNIEHVADAEIDSSDLPVTHYYTIGILKLTLKAC